MTKNEEKAHAMLNRWVAMKKELSSRSKEKRPPSTFEVNNLQECERWRNQIIKEITKKVADIQNASLGEYKIREINDEINKLFKEKETWEDKIKELGGVDYKKIAPKAIDAQGYELPGAGGYRYWGAAKDLPGVRELYAKEIPNAPKKSRSNLYKKIDFNYYGFQEDEEQLEELEQEAEKKMLNDYYSEIEAEENAFREPKKKFKVNEHEFIEKPVKVIRGAHNEDEFLKFKILHNPHRLHDAFAHKPSEEEMEKLILEKKKKHLIKMFDLDEYNEIVKENQELLKENKVPEKENK